MTRAQLDTSETATAKGAKTSGLRCARRPRVLWTTLALILFICLSTLSPRASSAASSRTFGLGIVLGDPTAITGKYWMDSRFAIDMGLAYNFDNFFTVYADYLHHWPSAFGGAKEAFIRELVPYLGIGGLFHSSEEPYHHKRHHHHVHGETEVNLLVRVPLGIEWLPRNVPIGVFLELVPGIFIVPEVTGAFMGGIGIRYYF